MSGSRGGGEGSGAQRGISISNLMWPLAAAAGRQQWTVLTSELCLAGMVLRAQPPKRGLLLRHSTQRAFSRAW